MDFVALTHRPNFGVDSSFLLEQETAGFEVADLGQHGALHYSPSFVVFDVAHPFRLVQRDFLCEALLFEIAYCIVVRVRQEVHDVARRPYVVLQMAHKMRTVTFDPKNRKIDVETRIIKEVPGLDTGGKPFDEYMKGFFFGMSYTPIMKWKEGGDELLTETLCCDRL